MLEIPADLPNQVAEIEEYNKFNRNKKALEKFNKFMTEQHILALAEYRSTNPDAGNNFGYNFKGNAYVRKQGTHVIIPEIIKYLSHPDGLTKTKRAILDEVKIALPKQAANIQDNIWYKPLKKSQWSKVQTLLQCRFAKPPQINGCKTLKEIRDRLVSQSITNSPVFKIKPNIVISREKVTVGDNIYNISKRESKGIEYPSIRVGAKRQWIRVDALKAFLAPENFS